ncbi:MAG TPA: succinate dehydrogenase assembly factor 2 [Steroidobacteraceae bacterium]|nr:succinate dehydrogenase assembly factor 2 [Steroidobacteraceae bacterium]
MTGAAPGQVRWRCRRGMKELDVLLVRWLERCWPAADPQARAAFTGLLELPDPQLADWLLQGARPGDAALAALVDDILQPRD